MKDKVNFKNIYREWVSTIFGTVILVMDGIYLWKNLKELTLLEIGVLLALGGVGLLFLFVRITTIEKYLPKFGGKE